jgi:putative Holliday junction resolvase
MRYLAIDYGNKHIGLALCDAAETVASPLTTIDGQKDLIAKIADIVDRENVQAVVVGLPLNMDDSVGAAAKKVFRFGEQLERELDVPVHFQDERLTTFSAEHRLAPAEFTKKKMRKHLDAVAAAEILESFLQQKGSQ